jgi:hypothetical protein
MFSLSTSQNYTPKKSGHVIESQNHLQGPKDRSRGAFFLSWYWVTATAICVNENSTDAGDDWYTSSLGTLW